MVPLILICSASLSLGSFIYYKNYYLKKNGNNVRERYSDLIHLLSGSNSVSQDTQGKRSFKFRFQVNGIKQSYLFSEVDNRLIIVWVSDSKENGSMSYEWSFANGYDQYRMFEEISSDILESSGLLLTHY